MFLDFYGLREQPFRRHSRSRVPLSQRYAPRGAGLLSVWHKADRGFVALIAESGMGKTTLLYRLMDELHDSARMVFLFQTNVILVSFLLRPR